MKSYPPRPAGPGPCAPRSPRRHSSSARRGGRATPGGTAAGCGGRCRHRQPIPKTEKAGQTAAQAWLLLLDRQDWGTAWDASSAVFRQTVPLGGWMDGIPKVREPFGALVERQPVQVIYKKTLAGPPGGRLRHRDVRQQVRQEGRVRGNGDHRARAGRPLARHRLQPCRADQPQRAARAAAGRALPALASVEAQGRQLPLDPGLEHRVLGLRRQLLVVARCRPGRSAAPPHRRRAGRTSRPLSLASCLSTFACCVARDRHAPCRARAAAAAVRAASPAGARAGVGQLLHGGIVGARRAPAARPPPGSAGWPR